MCIAGARVHESAGRLWPIAVRTGADVVSRFIRREGHWEIFDPNRLFKLANISSPTPPGTLLDIGSNLGFYSLAFAKAGWSVLAIEPMTQNRLALNLSLCANPDLAKRVRAIGVALGHPASQLNSSCVVRSYETRNVGDGVLTCGANARACGTTQATSASGGNNGLCENVRLMSLDALLSELRPQSIDAVKIGKTPKHCPCWPSPNLHPIRSPCFQLRAGHPLFLIRWFVDPCLCILTTRGLRLRRAGPQKMRCRILSVTSSQVAPRSSRCTGRGSCKSRARLRACANVSRRPLKGTATESQSKSMEGTRT